MRPGSLLHEARAHPYLLLLLLLNAIVLQTQTQRTVPVSNWNNAVYDAAFVLGLVTSDQQFTQVVHDFVQNYVEASGNNQIECAAL